MRNTGFPVIAARRQTYVYESFELTASIGAQPTGLNSIGVDPNPWSPATLGLLSGWTTLPRTRSSGVRCTTRSASGTCSSTLPSFETAAFAVAVHTEPSAGSIETPPGP